MAGFQTSTVLSRIAEIDTDVTEVAARDGVPGWMKYQALVSMALLRGVPLKTLRLKLFGASGKPSSAFKGAGTIATHFFAAGFPKDAKDRAREADIDDALAIVTGAIKAHMTALGKNGKNEYAKVAMFTDASEIPAQQPEDVTSPEAPDATNPPAATTDTAVSEPAAPEGPIEGKSEAEIVAEIVAGVKARGLSSAMIASLGAALMTLHAEVSEAERLVEAGPAGDTAHTDANEAAHASRMAFIEKDMAAAA